MHPPGLDCCLFRGSGSVVVDLLLIVTPIVGCCNCFMFCCALLCVYSRFAMNHLDWKERVGCFAIFGPHCEKTCLRWFANKKAADQPALTRSLISAFVIG